MTSLFKHIKKSAVLALVAAMAILPSLSLPAYASSHMDAPLITRDPSANTTDVYAFVRPDANGVKALNLALGVYPHQNPGIGPSKYNFDENVRYEIHVALGGDMAAGRPTITYRFEFQTRYKNEKTLLQSFLGVIQNIDDAAQNLTQTYTITKIDNRFGTTTQIGTGIVPPNNQGNATPFYNEGDNPEMPARKGVATRAELDKYTQQAIFTFPNGYTAFAGQRDDGFFADIQSIFDLLKLRNPGQDSQGGFNLHLMSLRVPLTELGGDQQTVGVFATTSRLMMPVTNSGGRGILDVIRRPTWVQVARQGNPLFNEGLVALEDKDMYSRQLTASFSANTPKVLNWLR